MLVEEGKFVKISFRIYDNHDLEMVKYLKDLTFDYIEHRDTSSYTFFVYPYVAEEFQEKFC